MGLSANLTGRPEFVFLKVVTYVFMPDCLVVKFFWLFSYHSLLYDLCIWKDFVEEPYMLVNYYYSYS